MKKVLLSLMMVAIVFSGFAQKNYNNLKHNIKSVSARQFNSDDRVLLKSPPSTAFTRPAFKGTNEVVVTNLGGGANAYGLMGGWTCCTLR